MKHWYTNGTDEKQIEEGLQPDNWYRGRSKIIIQKQVNTEMNKDPEIRKSQYERRATTNKDAHHVRTDETKQLMKEKRKAFFDNGGTTWLKGKSKYTDERLMKLSDSCRSGMLRYIEIKKQEDPEFYTRWRIQMRQKMHENGNACTSKPENDYYEYLISLFGKDDVIRWYADDSRYPFECDFYIKSQDLFIECNFYPLHGDHPFNADDPKDIEFLEDLRSINDNWSNGIIDVWATRDPMKAKIAKENGLNYIQVYDPRQQLNIASLHSNM